MDELKPKFYRAFEECGVGCKVTKENYKDTTYSAIIDGHQCHICNHCGELICRVLENTLVCEEPKKGEKVTDEITRIDVNNAYDVDTINGGMKLIKSTSVNLVCEDTPYGMAYVSNQRKGDKKFKKIQNDDNLDWLAEHILECKRILKEDSFAIFFCSEHYLDVFKQTIEKYLKIKNLIVWDKTKGGMGDLKGSLKNTTEYIIVAAKGNPKINGKRIANVLRIPTDNAADYQHPTQKPVKLLRQLIITFSKEKDIIFDGFAGSGTMPVAAEIEDRRWIAFEKEQQYLKIIKENVEKVRSNPSANVRKTKKTIKTNGPQTKLTF